MTTFARCSDQGDWGTASWEIRVVNHRYFDCVFKIPEIFRPLESSLRLQLQQQLHRGRVDCSLRFNSSEQGEESFVLNTPLVRKLVDVVTEIKGYLPMSTIDPMKILSWPRVLQNPEVDLTLAQEMVLNLFGKTFAELISTREREGAVLDKLLKEKLREMLVIVGKVKNKMPQILINQRQKVVKRLEEVVASLDQSRLEQEIVYFAQKIDVTEEIDRLEAHSNEVLRVLSDKGAVGKRLDFLMQELNREANTLASKSVDIEITQLAVELKVLIEQMREQVQNIV
ncbi:MAG: YicC family protein [Gammaproteobacteria bacterium]|nr:YicC family protein [Gammaproteobacteria bacterium]